MSRMGGRGEINALETTENFMVTNVTLVTDPNAPLAYALVLEHHHPIMSTLGDLRV